MLACQKKEEAEKDLYATNYLTMSESVCQFWVEDNLTEAANRRKSRFDVSTIKSSCPVELRWRFDASSERRVKVIFEKFAYSDLTFEKCLKLHANRHKFDRGGTKVWRSKNLGLTDDSIRPCSDCENWQSELVKYY